MRPGGNQPPVFFVPDGPNECSYAHALAINNDFGCPLFALPWFATERGGLPSTIEAMAAMMVGILRTTQLRGPYRLVGRSSGGILAYAIAHHLLSVDDTVSFLGLIDVELPSPRQEHNPGLERTGADGDRELILERAISNYEIPPLPIVVYLFQPVGAGSPTAQASGADQSTCRGWERLLQRASIRLLSFEGRPESAIPAADRVARLGTALSAALLEKRATDTVFRQLHARLIPLRVSQRRASPLVCVPGAGASVTSFRDLIDAYDDHISIYGLEPRGVDRMALPHGSVEAAAVCNLRDIEPLLSGGGIHLLGHSHGGIVAFEMARLLVREGRTVSSLTLIDSSPPNERSDVVPDVGNDEVLRDLVEALELTFERSFNIDRRIVSAGRYDTVVRELHRALREAKCVPATSKPDMLLGPLATFAAASRCAYTPPDAYNDKLVLVLARDPSLDPEQDAAERSRITAGWRAHAPNLVDWLGPGNHFSILKAPHVRLVVDKWREVWSDRLVRTKRPQ